jgi:hypothetical protein
MAVTTGRCRCWSRAAVAAYRPSSDSAFVGLTAWTKQLYWVEAAPTQHTMPSGELLYACICCAHAWRHDQAHSTGYPCAARPACLVPVCAPRDHHAASGSGCTSSGLQRQSQRPVTSCRLSGSFVYSMTISLGELIRAVTACSWSVRRGVYGVGLGVLNPQETAAARIVLWRTTLVAYSCLGGVSNRSGQLVSRT